MKKVLSLVLAAVLVVGLGAVAFGASNQDLAAAVKLGSSDNLAELPKDYVAGPYANDITLPIFTGTADSPKFFTEDTFKDYGMQVRAAKGANAIKGTKIVYAEHNHPNAPKGEKIAMLKIEFVDHLATTKDVDFELVVYPTYKKVRDANNKYEISGKYANDSQTVYANDDYIYIGDYPVVKADDYIRNIEVDLGENVSIFTRMFKGRDYYGRVSIGITADDEKFFNEYPDIEAVYNLETINLSATGDTVKFKMGDNMYLYVLDEEGNLTFLGRTDDRVPYFTKYFLSAKELDIEEVIEAPAEEAPGEEPAEDVGPTGGDDAPENVNDNPGTGR